MRYLVWFLLASCCIVSAARKNGQQLIGASLPREFEVFKDSQISVSRADPALLEQNGAKVSQGVCGVSYDCVSIKNNCTEAVQVQVYYVPVGGSWMYGGPWVVDPGATVVTFATLNRNFYLFVDGEYIGTVDLGPNVGSFTITISCDSKSLKKRKDVMDTSHLS